MLLSLRRLDGMSFLRGFCVSVYCTSTNLKISPVNPVKLVNVLKNDHWFKKYFVSWRFLCFYHWLPGTLKDSIWNSISGSENVMKNCGHFLLLFIVIYWNKKRQYIYIYMYTILRSIHGLESLFLHRKKKKFLQCLFLKRWKRFSSLY